jgi:hypothetical protein
MREMHAVGVRPVDLMAITGLSHARVFQLLRKPTDSPGGS